MTDALVHRITRNTAWLTIGAILQKLISFAYFLVVARVLGVRGTGQYFFALTYTAVFAVLADWGVGPVVTREVARGNRAVILPTATIVRIGTIAVAAGAATAGTYLLGYSTVARQMIAVATVAMVLEAIHVGGYAVLRGIQQLRYEAVGLVLGQITLAASGITILAIAERAGNGAANLHGAWFLVPYVLTGIVHVAITAIGIARERVWCWRWDRSDWRLRLATLLRTATPFAATALLARLYTYSDSILLSKLAPEAELGYYGLPFKIAFAFQFIPLALVAALYPGMSAASTRARDRLPAMFTESTRILLVAAAPLAVGIALLAPALLAFLYGPTFLPGALALAILAASIPAVFANFPAGYLLNACDRQSTNTALVAVATAVNVTANLLLIPKFGATGAAVSALIGSTTLVVLNFWTVHRLIRFSWHTIIDVVLRIGAAAAVMGTVITWSAARLPLPATVLLGACTYLVIAFATKAIRRSDIATLRASLRTTEHPPAATPAV